MRYTGQSASKRVALVACFVGACTALTAGAQAPEDATIAFRAARADASSLFLMEADGGDQRGVPNVEGSAQTPDWSLDGTRILYYAEVEGNFDIYSIQTDGEDRKRLTEDPTADRWPAWHPSGRQIIWSSKRDGNLEIYTMTANGNEKIDCLTND